MSKDLRKLWGTGAASTPPPASDERVEDGSYVAFDLRDRPERLHIQCATQPSRLPALSYLLDVVYDHDFQRGFTLIFSFMSVDVKGEHLGQIFHALHWGNCERITEYHPKLYPRKPPEDQPIITKIEILAMAHEPPPQK
jgi:hypothetical protein